MRKITYYVFLCLMFFMLTGLNPAAESNAGKFDVLYVIKYVDNCKVTTLLGNFKEKIKANTEELAIKKAKELLTEKYGKLLKFEVYYTIEYTKDGSKFRFK